MIKKLLNKSISLSLALTITVGSTLGAVLIQYYMYKNHIGLFSLKLNPKEPTVISHEKQTQNIKSDFSLPVNWESIGKTLVDIGVIDKDKFLSLLKSGPISGTDSEYESILSGNYDKPITLTEASSRFVLNTLWALGLAQKSKVLDD